MIKLLFIYNIVMEHYKYTTLFYKCKYIFKKNTFFTKKMHLLHKSTIFDEHIDGFCITSISCG